MGAVGGDCFVVGIFVWFMFVCFIAKENLFPFQKSEIPNIETVPCLFKNLEKCKKQIGVMITLKCRTLISDSMSVTGRLYHVTDGNLMTGIRKH